MKPLVLFDGHCALCHRSVRWLINHDSKRQLQFLSQENPLFETLLKQYNTTRPDGNSLLVLDHGIWYTHSNAVLQALRYVDSPWNALRVFRFIPSIVRNALYRIVARFRYRMFGYYTQCPLPDADLTSRLYTNGQTKQESTYL
ncbi:MAG: DUF393 domain-containing protein [Chitinophagaceae bacterium]|nr:DUF393 domain-containing protein [Chitinophagaceae bacterium]